MKKSVVLIIAAFVLMLGQAAYSKEMSAEELRINGNRHFALGNYDQAIRSFEECLKLDPENHKAYFGKGLAYFAIDEHQKALADYNRAIELAPNIPKYYNNRGNVYKEMGDLEKALADFNKAAELDEKYATVYYNRCGLYHDMGKFDLALKDCTKAVEKSAWADHVWIRRGMLYKEMGQTEKALKDLDKAASLKGNQAHLALFYRGMIKNEKGDCQAAIKDMQEAIAINDKDPKILAEFAWILSTSQNKKCRDEKKALDLAKKAVSISDSKNPLALAAFAAALAETGDFKAAMENQKKALELIKPDTPEAEKFNKCLELYSNNNPCRENQN